MTETPSTTAPAVDAEKVARAIGHDEVRKLARENWRSEHPGIAWTSEGCEYCLMSAAAELGAHAMQDAMAAALAAQAPGAVRVRGADDIASSLANMVAEYVDGGIRSNQDWRSGLSEVIAARLQRLTAAPPTDGYVDAFYAIAKMLGVVAQPASPKEVWEREIRPRLEALTAAPPVEREGATEIYMGRGLVDVGDIHHEGRSGILFRPRATHIPIGQPGEVSGEYWPGHGDVVIWIENRGGAEVIMDFLSPFLTTPAPSQQPAGEAGGLVGCCRRGSDCDCHVKELVAELRRLADEQIEDQIRYTQQADKAMVQAADRIEADATRIAALEAENARLRERLVEVESERDEAVNWAHIVDRHGVDGFDALAETWLAMEAIKRLNNAVTSVFAKWANDELMERFKAHVTNVMHSAFVEGALVGVRAEMVNSKAAEARAKAEAERDAMRDTICSVNGKFMEVEGRLVTAKERVTELTIALQFYANDSYDEGRRARSALGRG